MTASNPLLRSKGKERNRVLVILIPLILVVGSAVLLLLDSSGFSYYKYVDEVMTNPTSWQNKHLQIHGFVVPGKLHQEFDRERQTLRYEFTVENCGKQVAVTYFGLAPDTFAEQAEVVLKGKFISVTQGFLLQAEEIVTKCPSKYNEDPEQERARSNRCLHEKGK